MLKYKANWVHTNKNDQREQALLALEKAKALDAEKQKQKQKKS